MSAPKLILREGEHDRWWAIYLAALPHESQRDGSEAWARADDAIRLYRERTSLSQWSDSTFSLVRRLDALTRAVKVEIKIVSESVNSHGHTGTLARGVVKRLRAALETEDDA